MTYVVVAILAFCAGASVSFFTLPVWVMFAINLAREGSRTDWLGFFGGVAGGLMTLVGAITAWFAVKRQVAVAREVAFAKENEIWSILKEEFVKVIRRINYVWKNIDHAIVPLSNIDRRNLRITETRISLTFLPTAEKIESLNALSKELGITQRRQLGPVFYDLNQMHRFAKRWSSEPDEDIKELTEPDMEMAFFSGEMWRLQFWFTSFRRHLTQLDPELAVILADRKKSFIEKVESDQFDEFEELWRVEEENERRQWE